jgi:hypothetical protein
VGQREESAARKGHAPDKGQAGNVRSWEILKELGLEPEGSRHFLSEVSVRPFAKGEARESRSKRHSVVVGRAPLLGLGSQGAWKAQRAGMEVAGSTRQKRALSIEGCRRSRS